MSIQSRALLRAETIANLCDVSPALIRRLTRLGIFPKPSVKSNRLSLWKAEDLTDVFENPARYFG